MRCSEIDGKVDVESRPDQLAKSATVWIVTRWNKSRVFYRLLQRNKQFEGNERVKDKCGQGRIIEEFNADTFLGQRWSILLMTIMFLTKIGLECLKDESHQSSPRSHGRKALPMRPLLKGKKEKFHHLKWFSCFILVFPFFPSVVRYEVQAKQTRKDNSPGRKAGLLLPPLSRGLIWFSR